MAGNPLLDYAEELATKCEQLCKNIKGNPNAVFQLRKSSSSVFANITEAQYPQSLPDMLSKFKIARKECAETESWLKLLYNTYFMFTYFKLFPLFSFLLVKKEQPPPDESRSDEINQILPMI